MSWARFFGRASRYRDSAEELRSYLELETEENIARGMSPEAARRAAHHKLGSTVRIREEIYRTHAVGLLDALARDVRLVFRGIRRRPSFSLAVVLTLALGIGANTAIFGVVHGVLLKPLPYPDDHELVSIEHVAPGLNLGEFRMSVSQYFTYREQGGRVFRHIGLYGDGGTTITGFGEPEQARLLGVTHDVLLALGVQPQLGRLFREADTLRSGPAAATPLILSHAYWQRRFGGDPAVIGRRLVADSNPAEVVGVMPEGFRFLDMEPPAEVIRPIVADRNRAVLGNFGFWSLARLQPGVTPEAANAEIARLLPIWLDDWPVPPNAAGRQMVENWKIAPTVQPLKDDVVGGVGDMLWVLMATIGMVLLIACANVANLMLVRSESRRQEFAVRTALGAGRTEIVREVLVESVVLSTIGGALGVALASAALTLVVRLAPTTLPRAEDISLDPSVLVFATAVSLGSSLLFGAIPALRYAARPVAPLGNAARGASVSRERQRTRHALVIAQVALALVLLVGSGLMLRTFQALLNVQAGFSTRDVQTARIWIPPQQVADEERVIRMHQEILDKIAGLPGVTAAGFGSSVPMEGPLRVAYNNVFVEGTTYQPGQTPPLRRMKLVGPGYFGAIGTRLVAGRDLSWNDVYSRATVAVISENFAREIWGSAAAALGRRVRESEGASPWREIVGVVEDVHEDALHQAAPPTVYWPVLMENFGGNKLIGLRPINLVIRSAQAGRETLLGDVRRAVWSVNPNLPVFLVRTMQDLYDESMARTSFALVMLGLSATMALVLGAVGIYGVLAYIVAQRSREIGIRLALGAAPVALLRMFVRQGLALAAVGAATGLVIAIALTRWMSSLLFGVERLDPPTYLAVLGVLGVAAALASYFPARRAAAVDPVQTLTAE